jgi:hypothetical protein
MGRGMKVLLMLVIVTAMVSATGCASKSSEEVQPSHGVTSGPRLVIDLKPGPYYNGTATSFLVFRYTVSRRSLSGLRSQMARMSTPSS